MAIKINSIVPAKVNDDQFTFKDIHLDLNMSYTKNSQANKINEVNDMQADLDVNAIKNSLLSIFTTLPGQKLLTPSFGLNLAQFLFIKASTATAQLVGEAIQRGINTWEPRVNIRQINVEVDEDNNQYNIDLSLYVPTFKQNINLKGLLKDSRFYYI